MRRIDVPSVLLGIVAGALAGGGTAYLLASHRASDRLDAEVAELKAHFATRLNEEAKSLVEIGHPTVGVDDQEPAESRPARSRVPYHAIGNRAVGDVDPDSVVEAPVGEPERAPGDGTPWPPPDRDVTKPHLLSSEEFFDEDPPNSKVTLTWYRSDFTLVDEQQQPIPNAGYILGDVKFTQFGGVSDDDRIMYVRNPRLETDFEVILHDGGYGEIILNYGRPQ